MKILIIALAILVSSLVGMGCKSTSDIKNTAATAADVVTMVVKPGLKPSALVKRSPFAVVTEKLADKQANRWDVKFDLGKYKMQDLTNYLINLDQVVSVNGIEKAATPPVGPKAKQQTKKM